MTSSQPPAPDATRLTVEQQIRVAALQAAVAIHAAAPPPADTEYHIVVSAEKLVQWIRDGETPW
jgi:hypothetical protein